MRSVAFVSEYGEEYLWQYSRDDIWTDPPGIVVVVGERCEMVCTDSSSSLKSLKYSGKVGAESDARKDGNYVICGL